jgi:hypothetical protein
MQGLVTPTLTLGQEIGMLEVYISTNTVRWMRDYNVAYLETTEKGMNDWTEHVYECGKGLLANEVDSWMTGVNTNLAHRQRRLMTRYYGPASGYRRRCGEVKGKGYVDFDVKRRCELGRWHWVVNRRP